MILKLSISALNETLRSVVALNGTPSQVLETGLGLGKRALPVTAQSGERVGAVYLRRVQSRQTPWRVLVEGPSESEIHWRKAQAPLHELQAHAARAASA